MRTMKLNRLLYSERPSLMIDLTLIPVAVTRTGQEEFGKLFFVVNERNSLLRITRSHCGRVQRTNSGRLQSGQD